MYSAMLTYWFPRREFTQHLGPFTPKCNLRCKRGPLSHSLWCFALERSGAQVHHVTSPWITHLICTLLCTIPHHTLLASLHLLTVWFPMQYLPKYSFLPKQVSSFITVLLVCEHITSYRFYLPWGFITPWEIFIHWLFSTHISSTYCFLAVLSLQQPRDIYTES